MSNKTNKVAIGNFITWMIILYILLEFILIGITVTSAVFFSSLKVLDFMVLGALALCCIIAIITITYKILTRWMVYTKHVKCNKLDQQSHSNHSNQLKE